LPSDIRHFRKRALLENTRVKSQKSNNRADLVPHFENICNAVVSLGDRKKIGNGHIYCRYPDFRNEKSGTPQNQRSTGSVIRPDLFPVQ